MHPTLPLSLLPLGAPGNGAEDLRSVLGGGGSSSSLLWPPAGQPTLATPGLPGTQAFMPCWVMDVGGSA